MKSRVLLITLALVVNTHAAEWTKLPAVPDKEGFAGSFAGVSNDSLLIAGGANFPDKKPWDGGKKVWYDGVFVLENANATWRVAGKLPRPLGYGVSVTHRSGVICVGGSDSERHHADAFRLSWNGKKLVTSPLPSLPLPIANACGALVGDAVFVSGGQEKPDSTTALNETWKLDLSAEKPEWEKIERCPAGGRMLAIAASHDGAFWIAGGVKLVAGKDGTTERRYLRDAYRYDAKTGWKQIADLPHAIAAAPTPAPVSRSGFYILGGDDGTQVGVAHAYHRGFGKAMIGYSSKTGKWDVVDNLKASRVTVPCVEWNHSWVIPSGEMRPGIRSPEVWRYFRAPE